jgi:predicted transcriptional regulator
MMAKTPTFGIRLDPAVKAALQKMAKQDKRPLSSFIHKILEEYVEAQQPEGGRKARK